MFIEERHQAILDILKADGRVSVGDIQRRFSVSLDSARRDLRLMEERGLLKRTHGGAVPLPNVDSRPPRVRDFDNMPADPCYDAIAKRGAELITENSVVYLTSGSLGFLALKYLPTGFNYTLVLNSPALCDRLKYYDNLTVYITGGKMRMHGSASIVDSFAAAFVKNMRFDMCILTGAGITAEFGLSNGTDETATFQRAVIESSRRRVLLMPGVKVGLNAFIKVADIGCFDALVTDENAVEDELAKIEEAGTEVITAQAE